jgi:hypothetical protein
MYAELGPARSGPLRTHSRSNSAFYTGYCQVKGQSGLSEASFVWSAQLASDAEAQGESRHEACGLRSLDHTPVSDSAEAYRLLNFELLLMLLHSAEVSHSVSGATPVAVPALVRIFPASLPEADRRMAKSRAGDFVVPFVT